jgi:hypothetical protein
MMDDRSGDLVTLLGSSRRRRILCRSLAPLASGLIVLAAECASMTPVCAQVPNHGIRDFTESGSLEVPPGVSHVLVELWGAGGGGGAGASSGATAPGGGGGGGRSGSYVRAHLTVAPGEEYVVTVGAGGRGGSVTSKRGDQSGSDGEDSAIRRGDTVVLIARGGRGGRGGSFSGGAGGDGGAPTREAWMLVRAGRKGYAGDTGLGDHADFTAGGRGGDSVAGSVTPVGSLGGDGGSGALAGSPAKEGADGRAGYVLIAW